MQPKHPLIRSAHKDVVPRDVARNIIRDIVRPVYGIETAAQDITWLLSFNLNGTATVPSDGTGDVTDGFADTTPRYPRVWDSTNGLVLSPVYGKAFISEGMRISYDTDEASLGSEEITNGDFDTDTDWVKGTNITIGSGVCTFSSTPNGQLVSQPNVFTVGKTYEITYQIASITEGSFYMYYGSLGTQRTSSGTYTETATATNTTFYIRSGGTTSGTIDNVSVKEITPAFLNSVSKADSTKLHPSKTGADGNEIMLQFEPRTNAESVTSEDYRYTGDADPHNFYYQNQTLVSPATTSLTAPLRDSEGRFYEELVKNGSNPPVDAEWNKGVGWSISGNKFVCAPHAGLTNLEQTHWPTQFAGKTIKTVYTIDTYTAGTLQFGYFDSGLWTYGTLRSSADDFTDTLTVPATATAIAFRGSFDADYSLTSISIIEVDSNGNPTNVLDGGVRVSTTNYLINSATPATHTTGTLTAGWYSVLTWGGPGSVAITAGTATIGTPTGSASEGVPAYFEVTADGTVTATLTGSVDKFQLQGGVVLHEQTAFIETTTGSEQIDENVSTSVLWSYGGRYSNLATASQNYLPHVINHPTYLNYLLNSDTPATQTTGSLSTGTYTIYVDDAATGSATIAANTATIDAGGAATAGNPFTFTVTGAGTVDVTVAATVNKFQLNDGSTRLPYTPTTSGTEQVDSTDYTATWLGGLNNFAIRGRASVADINRNNYLFGITGTGTNILNLRLASGGGGITSTRFFDGVLDANITNTGSSVSQGEVFYWGVVVDDQGTGKVYFNGVASAGSFSADSFGALDTVALGRYTTSLVMNGGNTDVAVYTGSDLSDFASNITWDDPK